MRAVISHGDEVSGKVSAPPSKSLTHRALICSALADGSSRVHAPLTSEDTEVTCDVLGKLGIHVGRGSQVWTVDGGRFGRSREDFYCRGSGTTLRFFTALCALGVGRYRLTGDASLMKRPVRPLVEALTQLGVECHCEGEYPPVVVKSGLKGGEAQLPGDVSSQFVSAILLASPLAESPVHLKLTTPLESKPYVTLTIEAQREFGVKVEASEDLREYWVNLQRYRCKDYRVEGDWSSAAPLLALGLLRGKVTVENLNPRSSQADRRIIDILALLGAKVDAGDYSISVESSELKPIAVDVSDCPDLFPTVTALCSIVEGRSTILGIRRLRIKESDRVRAMCEGLAKLGIPVIDEEEDQITIEGSKPSRGIVDPMKDHRIAMAFAILGHAGEGVEILNAECISKSYPRFWDDLAALGGRVEVVG